MASTLWNKTGPVAATDELLVIDGVCPLIDQLAVKDGINILSITTDKTPIQAISTYLNSTKGHLEKSPGRLIALQLRL